MDRILGPSPFCQRKNNGGTAAIVKRAATAWPTTYTAQECGVDINVVAVARWKFTDEKLPQDLVF